MKSEAAIPGGISFRVGVDLNGTKIEGRLLRNDDFLVVLMLADGTRKSMMRDNGIPRVEVKDPKEGHKKMLLEMDDPDNKNMHDITAYLAAIK